MRSRIYDIASLGLIGVSIYFFYQSVMLLAGNDYVGAVIIMLIGFMIIRVGVELSRIAVIAAQKSDKPAGP